MGKQKPIPGNSSCTWCMCWRREATLCPRISRNYHVIRSLFYAWIRLYRERGEAAFVPDRAAAAPPEIERPENTEEQVASLERLCGQQALELDLLRSGVDLLKKVKWTHLF